MPKASDNDNRPIHTVRHRRLKSTIWRNDTDKGVMFNVIITRSYRDKATNEWRDTNSIGYDDLMNVAALMYEAHGYISNLNAKPPARGKPRSTSRPTSQATLPGTAPRVAP